MLLFLNTQDFWLLASKHTAEMYLPFPRWIVLGWFLLQACHWPPWSLTSQGALNGLASMCKWQSKRLVLSMARWQRQIRSCLSVSQAVLNSFVVFVSLSLSRSLSFEVLEVGIYYLLQYIIGMTCWMTCPLGQMPQRFFSLASRKTCSPMFSNTQNLEERWQMLPPASDFSETGLKAFFNGLDCAPSCTIHYHKGETVKLRLHLHPSHSY